MPKKWTSIKKNVKQYKIQNSENKTHTQKLSNHPYATDKGLNLGPKTAANLHPFMSLRCQQGLVSLEG